MRTERLEAARALACVARSRGDLTAALSLARATWGDETPGSAARILKDALISSTSIGISTGDADATQWVTAYNAMIDSAKSPGVLDQIQKISPFVTANPNEPVLISDVPPDAQWRPEGGLIVVSNASFKIARIGIRSLGGILLFTVESVRILGNENVRALSASIADSIGAAESYALTNPDGDGSDGVTPQSLTYGAPQIASTGTDAASIQADVGSMLGQFSGNLGASAWVMNPQTCVRLAMLGNAIGSADLSIAGGAWLGLPVVVNRGVDPSTITLVDPSGVVLVSDPAVFDVATEGTVSVTDDDGTVLETHSLWQENLYATKFVRSINWQAAPGRVVALTGMAWPDSDGGTT
ncbi:phage major capsid protein [Paraburkholderia saeva]|uniref:Phage capsid-like C-terminal domain-containing protein n=1 Tax=Paraburkholderia saeva TaxID=2777537 RepID=A0A9N8X2L0_9BURK|nr:phage major capsid protein [Paraburkholderia saeva]CAG4905716.1 hypothetical protein LMG31841_03479 [Paraburkholderia saeva]